MDLRTEYDKGRFTAHLRGSLLYADNGAFRTLIEDMSASGAKHCVFDVSGLTAIDSAGLGMLVIASDASKKNGWSLTLTGASGQVRKVLELSRFDQLMTIAD